MLALLALLAPASASEFVVECAPTAVATPFRALVPLANDERSYTASGRTDRQPLIEVTVSRLDDDTYEVTCTVQKGRHPAQRVLSGTLKPGDSDSASLETRNDAGAYLRFTYAQTTIESIAH